MSAGRQHFSWELKFFLSFLMCLVHLVKKSIKISKRINLRPKCQILQQKQLHKSWGNQHLVKNCTDDDRCNHHKGECNLCFHSILIEDLEFFIRIWFFLWGAKGVPDSVTGVTEVVPWSREGGAEMTSNQMIICKSTSGATKLSCKYILLVERREIHPIWFEGMCVFSVYYHSFS